MIILVRIFSDKLEKNKLVHIHYVLGAVSKKWLRVRLQHPAKEDTNVSDDMIILAHQI